MPTAVVTGANSGIGHALSQLLIKEGYNVIAADVTLGDPIKALGCRVEKVDVASPDSISDLEQKLDGQAVDLLLNVAGVMDPPKNDTLSTVNANKLSRAFTINAFGPLLLTQALLPNLTSAQHPRVAVMSSRMGSISDNSSGGQYAYRGSKAAVNAMFKSLAVDLKGQGVAVIILHPGIVKTNLTTEEETGMGVEPEQAAGELWKVIVSKGLESSGRWWHRSGEELPW